jgi:ectoine hydroxylase-related dioxygenase (phytanoyl-CoA dioxygenase family)
MDCVEFERQMADNGYAVFERVLPADLLEALRRDIPERIAASGEWQRKNGIQDAMEGVAHHVVGGDDSLATFLETCYLDEYIRAYFSGGEYILNSYGAIDNLPHSSRSYAHGQRFHRDVRTYSGDFRLMVNMLVMVDDFTLENGATKMVPGSHRVAERPDDAEIERRTVRLVGPAGSIVLFDSNLWHSAAPNLTSGSRKALTLTFTRPFCKQQMDYPRMLGEDWPRDERMRQLLGYNARVPASYDEWYQPPERRMYKPGQG